MTMLCFPRQYPVLLGGTTSATSLTSVAYDSTTSNVSIYHFIILQFVVGGASSDPNVISTVATPNAFAACIGTSGQYLWTAQFNPNDYDSVGHVAYTKDFTKVLIGL